MVFVKQKINKIYFTIFLTLVLIINTRVFALKKNNVENFDRNNENINIYLNYIEKNRVYDYYRWKAILHKDNRININDKNFWLSGKKTPKAELIALINKIYSENFEEKKYIVCKFPARIKFLLEEVGVEKEIIKNINCNEFEEYLNAISAQKVYLSYASEDITSPISMMGHLFIKISGFNVKQNRIVENSLNYFATINLQEESTIMFYIKSLFYGSNGIYTITPYRQKLIEYNDNSNRNIYNYELNLNKNQLEYFIYHIWELKDINVPYNFITNNCGTATLSLLNVIDENFKSILDDLYITPVDILKKLEKKKLIKSVELYPADNYKIQLYKNNFSNKELKEIKDFVVKNDNKILFENRKNDLLFMADMISGSYMLNNKITMEQYNKIQKDIYNNFDGMESINLQQEDKNQLKSPFSSAIKLNYSNYKRKHGMELNFYPVYRDLTDDNSQYFNDFSLLMLNANLFIGDDLILKSFDLIKLKSIMPTSDILPVFSFDFRVGYQDNYEKDNNNGNFIGEIGIGKAFDYKKITSYFMIDGGFFVKPYVKFEYGIIFKFKNTKTIINYDYFLQNNRNLESILSINESIFLNENFSFGLNFEKKIFENNKKSYSSFNSGIKIYF